MSKSTKAPSSEAMTLATTSEPQRLEAAQTGLPTAGARQETAKTLVKAFLAGSFKHGKAIGAVAAAAPVVKAARLPGVAAGGTPKLGVFVGDDVGEAWIEALKTPRFRNRDVEAVAA